MINFVELGKGEMSPGEVVMMILTICHSLERL